MIRTFTNLGPQDIFDGKSSSVAGRISPRSLWNIAYRKLVQFESATEISGLGIPPGNRLEQMKGDRNGQHGIRINERYRIFFKWIYAGPEEVEIADYHK